MKLYIYTVFDTKADAFLPPFFLPNDQIAARAFSDCANSQDHQFGKNPNDYVLYKLGFFEDSTGAIVPSDAIENLGSAQEHRRKTTEEET